MPPHTNPHHDRRWLILAIIGLAQLMVVLDVTIVNIALPSAQEDLGFSNDARQWIITAYALAFGSLLLLGGRLGDLFGRKWTFVAGLIGFSVASAVGGAADSFGVLVAARATQGAFGALLAPSALALLTTIFTDPAERGKAFGIFGAIAGGGSAIGLLLGGILTETLSWRWCLYVNLLIAIPTAIAAFRLLAQRAAPARPRIDLLGTALATSGLFALVFGFSNSETQSWGDPLTISMLTASAVLLGLFAFVESRVANPLLPLRVIADRTRGGSYLAIGISGVAIFAVFLFLTYYLQTTKGFSPIETGLAFLPMTAAIMITATSVNIRFLAKVGPRPLLILGMSLGAIAMAWLAQITVDSTYVGHILPGADRDGHRDGEHLRPGVRERHLRRRPPRQRRRVGDGEHDAADRRLDRHRAAELDLRERGDVVRRRPAAHPAAARRGRRARLHDRLLGRRPASSPSAPSSSACCCRRSGSRSRTASRPRWRPDRSPGRSGGHASARPPRRTHAARAMTVCHSLRSR